VHLPRTSRLAFTALLVFAAGCSAPSTETVSPVTEPTTEPSQPLSTTTTAITEQSSGETEPVTSSTAPASDADCVVLADFESAEQNDRWQTVNDNVMGGQSEGGPSFDGGLLNFTGDINTDGGGFSSLRLLLEPEQLVGVDRVIFRARTDGRPYMVTFDDNVRARDRRVSHRAEIPFAPSSDWQTATVTFAELFPAIFGRPIEDTPFQPELATRMGIMISDSQDGPFNLQVDWIKVCSAGTTP